MNLHRSRHSFWQDQEPPRQPACFDLDFEKVIDFGSDFYVLLVRVVTLSLTFACNKINSSRLMANVFYINIILLNTENDVRAF